MSENEFNYKGFTVDFEHAQFRVPLTRVQFQGYPVPAALVWNFESPLGEQLLSEMIRTAEAHSPYAPALNRYLYQTLV